MMRKVERTSSNPNVPPGRGWRLDGKVVCVVGGGLTDRVADGLRDMGAHVVSAPWPKRDDYSKASLLVARTLRRTEGLDALVVMVDGMVGDGTLLQQSNSGWRRTITDPLGSAFSIVQGATKLMAKRSGGAIIIVGPAQESMSRISTTRVVGGGLSTLVRSLAIAFGQYEITVNGIIPGQLSAAQRTRRKNPDRTTGRQADLSDIVGPIAYLASRDTTYLTGQVILVDGGLSLRTALPESR